MTHTSPVYKVAFLLLLLCGWPRAATVLLAQKSKPANCPPNADTTAKDTRKKWVNNIFQQAWSSIQKTPGDTAAENIVLNTRSEDQYACFEGKVIRNITLTQFGFDRNFIDTSKRITSLAARVARTLHRNTRPWVVANNLFFKENETLDPYIIADNERFLRTLDFLQDARILVDDVPGTMDSVDVTVVTKDVFSIKADVDNNGITAGKIRLRENNFLGMGQQVGGGILYDPQRTTLGYDLSYTKNNICGTFIHGTIAFSNTNAGRNLGLENEESYAIRLSRPLPSPYFRLTGGLEAITSHSVNVFRRNDSFFTNYRYNLLDVWAGYNLFLNDILGSDHRNRERKFFALRYINQQFTDLPQRYRENYDFIYNSREAILGQFTFFKQNFVKTQYIYGFGITEDVPYGYNISLTGGFWEQRDLRRPYAGINVDYYTAKSEGAFCQYYLRTGGFYQKGKIEDASLLAGASYFSKLFFVGDAKIRQYVRATYTHLFNRITYQPLRIDNDFGIRGLGTDTLYGTERISLQSETAVFTKLRFQGFKFAPFLFSDIAVLRGESLGWNKSDVFTGIGGGLRTRNENFIFGTIELKAVYYPRVTPGGTQFRISLVSDLRFRYNTNYINPPDIIRLNSIY